MCVRTSPNMDYTIFCPCILIWISSHIKIKPLFIISCFEFWPAFLIVQVIIQGIAKKSVLEGNSLVYHRTSLRFYLYDSLPALPPFSSSGRCGTGQGRCTDWLQLCVIMCREADCAKCLRKSSVCSEHLWRLHFVYVSMSKKNPVIFCLFVCFFSYTFSLTKSTFIH